MAEMVNLRRAKKAKARAAAEDAAGVNRARYGTPKPLRKLTKARSEKAARDLEAGRLEPGKEPKER
jgi:hypothetical protein